VSTGGSWSDSRKRSRFTTAGGGAATAITLTSISLVLDKFHASTAAQIADAHTSGTPDDVDRLSGGMPPSDDTSSLYRQLDEIEAAQQRIADGTYGVCFGCGRPIPVSRLRASPYARHCLPCEMRLTKVRTPEPMLTERHSPPNQLRSEKSDATTSRGENRHG